MDDHMKIVARRFAEGKSRKVFYKYLLSYGWTREQVDRMWDYAQKYGRAKNETDSL